MTRFSIQLLKIILWIILSGIILLIVISHFFGENIQKSLLKNINENLQSELHVENMDISLIENFPSATLKLMEVYIQEAEGFQMDTLVYAKEIYTEIRLLDIIRKKFEIQRIVILNGVINLKYNNLQQKNFDIFKKKDGSNKLNLGKVILLNSNVSYTNSINNTIIKIFPEKLLLTIQHDNYTDLEIDGKLLSKQLTIYNKNYADQKKIYLNGGISFKKDSLFIRKSELNIEDVTISITGGVYHKNITDLYIGCQNQSFKSIMKNTPTHLNNIYNAFNADGSFSCEASILGLIAKRKNPAFKMSWVLRQGSFDLKNNPFTLRDIYMNGEMNNGDSNNFQETEIKATEFNARTGNGTIKGSFNIQNLNSYFLQTEIESIWDLAEVNYFSENSPFFNLNGKLQANTSYDGRLSFDNNFKTHFRNSKHKTKATLTDVSFMYKNSSLPFTLNNVKCEIDGNKIIIYESTSTIADSDLEFDGKVTDFIGYILKQDSSFEIDGNLKSVYVKFDEILTINTAEDRNSTSNIMPVSFNCNVRSQIENFSYKGFLASNLNGEFIYTNQTLSVKDIKMETLNGSLYGDIKFYESPKNHMKLFAKINMKDINIRDGFTSFNNFGQDFIQDRHIKGIGSAEIELQAAWKPGFILERDKLKMKSHLIIEKGELIQFKPLESLSSYVSVEDLRDVKFSTLENTIEIDNSVIQIPAMEIKSSALSVYLSGTHTFEKKIDYQIKLLLSEILSNKFRKENTNIQKNYGEIEKNENGFSTIYLKMTGKTDNPEISFDRIKISEKLKENIEKQKEEIQQIIKEDILQKDSVSNIEEGEKPRLEWDDEDN